MKVASLYVYPVKSLGGFSPEMSVALKRGFEFDRRWMLVDHRGEFISQRSFPRLAQYYVSVEDNNLIFRHRAEDIQLIIEEANSVDKAAISVRIWRDTLHARGLGKKVDRLVSDFLNIPCKLVYMGIQDKRWVDQDPEREVSFADGYPYLITTTASIKDLSAKHGQDIAISRFRPNIVVSNEVPWEEDLWHILNIGETSFEIVKPCARCQVPGIDQTNGQTDEGILKSLAKHRRQGNSILFGVNARLSDDSHGMVSVGDEVRPD